MLGVLAVNEKNLAIYIKRVNQFKLLSPEEEFELARKWYEDKDKNAAKQLILSNLRFVVKIALEYAKYKLPLSDLIQEGNIGLMKAVKKFNPYKGIRLINYAVYWIRAQIHDFIRRSYRIVKIATTKLQKKVFNMLQSQKSELYRAINDDSETREEKIEEIAKKLNTSPQKLIKIKNSIKTSDISLDAQVSDDINRNVSDYIPSGIVDPEEELAEKEIKEKFNLAIEIAKQKMNEREKFILENRILSSEPLKLNEIGDMFGISKERVRQIEKNIIKKIKKAAKEVLNPLSNELPAA